MRSIQVSDSTYAAIWARWKEGDDGEEGVLRRLLGLGEGPPATAKKTGRPYVDGRYGVEFPEGFEIFRVFKGKERRAVVQDGHWMADNNRLATSLNQLSAHVGAPTENAWRGWYYMDGNHKRLIAELRDPSKVKHHS